MTQKQTFRFQDRQAYIDALDTPVKMDLVQTRKLGGNRTHSYLPFPVQQAIADLMFQSWNVISEDYQTIANEIICTVKLSYIPAYPEADADVCSGSAAGPIQMKSGAKITEFPEKKITNALEYNLPSVRNTAIGNALESLGNVFGRNISRKLNGTTSLPADFSVRRRKDREEKDNA